MSAAPETTTQGRHFLTFNALYQNARQPIRTLAGPLIVIGRARGCDLVLGSESVAPAHLAIVFSRGECFACDLGGPRGTILNGRPIRTQRLTDGDELTIGNFRFRVDGITSESSSRASAPRFTLAGSGPIGRLNCSDPVMVIGSDLGADLVIRDSDVAGVQCLIAWTDGGVIARDVGGGAGISVNGRRSSAEVLRGGDVIVIGPHDIRFEADTASLPGSGEAPTGDELAKASDRALAPVSRTRGADLTLEDSEDANWADSLAESDEVNLDVELSRDLKDLKQARSEIASAKDALERERTQAPSSAVLSSEALGEVMMSGARGATRSLPQAMPSVDVDAQRRSIEAERSVLAAERANLDALRAEMESQRRQLATSRGQVDTRQAEFDRRIAEMEAEGRRIANERQMVEADKAELRRIKGEIESQGRDVSQMRSRHRQEQAEMISQRSALANEVAVLTQRKADLLGEAEDAAQQQARQAQVRSELEASRSELTKVTAETEGLRKQALRDRTTVSELMATLEQARRDRDSLRAKHSEEGRTKQTELETLGRELTARTQSLEKRSDEIEQRERAVNEKVAALRERAGKEQKKLDDHAMALRTTLDEQRERQRVRQLELEDLGKKLEEARARLTRDVETTLTDRTRELDERGKSLDEKTTSLQRRLEEFERQTGGMKEREDRLERAAAELRQREATLSSFESALQERDARLREWQVRVERDESKLDDVRRETETTQKDATAIKQQIDRQRAEIEAQRESVGPELAKVEAARAALTDREKHLEEFKGALDQRDAQLAARHNELETWAARVASQEERLDDANARLEEAQRREETVTAGESALVTRLAQADLRDAELTALKEKLDRRRGELESRETAQRERETTLGRAKADFEVEVEASRKAREEARVMRDEATRRAGEADTRESENQRRATQLDEMEVTLRTEENTLEDERTALRREQTQLKSAHEGLTADLATLARQQNELDQRASDFSRQQEEIQTLRTTLHDERIRLEAMRVGQADEGRRLEASAAEIAGRRAELEQRAAEIEQQNHELANAGNELTARRQAARAEDDALASKRAAIDARQAELDDRGRAVLRDEAAINHVRAQLDEEKSVLASLREQTESDRRLVEQTRLTYAAGLSQLEARQREHGDREAQSAEQARQAAALQQRMEAELDRLQQEREQLLGLRQSDAAEGDRLKVLSGQLETQRLEMKRQEDALIAHERALQARTDQLAQIEVHLQSRMRELEERSTGAARDREDVERERIVVRRDIEQEKASVAEARAAIEQELRSARARDAAELAAAREEFSRRKADLEREYAEKRSLIEASVRQKIAGEHEVRGTQEMRRAQETLANAEARLASVDQDIAERLRQFEVEMQRRRNDMEQDSAARRAATEDALAEKQREIDELVDELRRRQSALASEEAAIASQADELSAESAAAERRMLRATEIEHSAEQRMRVVETRQSELAAFEDEIRTRRTAELPKPAEAVRESEPDEQPVVAEGPDEPGEVNTDGSGELAVLLGDDTPFATPKRSWGRAAVLTGVFAGLAAIGAWYVLPTPSGTGTLKLASGDARNELLRQVTDADFWSRISTASGTDLIAAVNARQLTVVPESKESVRIEANSQAMADLAGRTIAADLSAAPAASEIPGKRDLEQVRSERAAKATELQSAEQKLAALSAAVSNEGIAKKIADAERIRETRREAVVKAEQTEQGTSARLAAAEKAEDSNRESTPDDLAAALASDPSYGEARRDCISKARGLRDELIRVAGEGQQSFGYMASSMEDFRKASEAQKAQTADASIRTTLVELEGAADLTGGRCIELQKQWDELFTPIRGWQDGSDATALTSSVEKASVWMLTSERELAQLMEGLGKRVDAITANGSDMAARRVIESGLQKRRRAYEETYRQLRNAIAQVLAKENFKVHALSEAISDLTRRAERRKAAIEKVVKAETKHGMGEARRKTLSALSKDQAEAKDRHNRAVKELMAADEELAMLKQASERASRRRDDLTAQHVAVGDLKEEIKRLDARISEADSAETPAASPSPQAEYQAASSAGFLSGGPTYVRPLMSGILAGLFFALMHRMFKGGRRRAAVESAS